MTPELLSTLKCNGRSLERRTLRATVDNQCARHGGRHLVLVRYAGYEGEIVYNSADIDSQDIVWAREMDDVRDRALIEHFGDRKVWLLELGDGATSLRPVRP